MNTLAITKAIKILNAIDVLGFCFLLIIAFAIQLILQESPCPLCILQRIGILAMSFGFLLNVKFRIRPVHYTLSLFSALLTATISARQIFLHIIPGDAGFGSSIFGLHLYTWVFIVCVVVIIYIATIFSISPQYSYVSNSKITSKTLQRLTHLAFTAVLLLTALNGISFYLQCGFNGCQEEPTKYEIQLVEIHSSHT